MEEKDLLKKLKEESKNRIPDVYDKVVDAANAQGLFYDDTDGEEVYADGETAILSGISRKAIAITALSTIAVACLAIALPLALCIKHDGGLSNGLAADIELGEDYAVGAVSTAKLAEVYLDEADVDEAYVHGTAKPVSLVVNPGEDGIDRYISEFDNYFYACNSFFGEQPATVNYVTDNKSKYDNSVVVSGYFSNGDVANYSMYYSEARILDDTTVTGSEVKYYLEGYFYLNNKGYFMYGERVYTDSTKSVVKSLSIKAFPSRNNTDNYVQMSVEYNADGSVKQYDYNVTRNGATVSESVLIFPDNLAGDEAYSIEFTGDDGDREGIFTVNHPQNNSLTLSVSYQIGIFTSQFHAYATKNTLERVITPDGLEYDDNGDGTYKVSGYRKDVALPEVLLIPDEVGGIKVTAVGASAFSFSKGLKEVIIPEGITEIDSSAFAFCSNIVNVQLPESLTKIGGGAFRGCIGVENFTCPENLESIGDYAFTGCINLKNFTCPENLESIGGSAFSECTNLKNLYISAKVNSIGLAFLEATSIESITVDSANETYYVETGCIIEKETLTVIGGCVGFTIPDNVINIGAEAFQYCTHFTSLVLPASVKYIGSNAFYATAVENLEMRGVETIVTYAFANTKIKELVLPETVTSVGSYAFNNCTSLKSVKFPASMTVIVENMMTYCSNLETITVAAGNPNYHSVNNCLIQTRTKKLVLGCSTSIIPDDGSVEIIGSYAFEGQTNMREIIIPSTVYSIGNYAFYSSGLENVIIPDSVTSMGSYALGYCRSLKTVTLSANLRMISLGLLFNCDELVSVTLPEKIDYIDNSAFQSCVSLRTIVIPDSVTTIGAQAFESCINLISITLPSNLETIMNEAFKGCLSIRSIRLPSSLISIGNQAFYGCSQLNSIYFDGDTATWLNSISKGVGWDFDTNDYFVDCTDGVVNKEA